MSTIPTQNPPVSPTVPDIPPEYEIDYDSLVTEDHRPVDRILFEKLMRLLTRPLYACWPGPGEGRPFLVLTDVGYFYQYRTPPVSPDCLLSLDVTYPKDVHRKQGHSYFQWDMGKPPDAIIEMVSDRTGDEESFKKDLYARLRVTHYAIFDPEHLLSSDTLRTYELALDKYRLGDAGPWPDVGLGLRLWDGQFEGLETTWLRWCDANGKIIPTGEERAVQEARRADQAEECVRELEAQIRMLRGEPPLGTR